jgi:hypothetical protein
MLAGWNSLMTALPFRLKRMLLRNPMRPRVGSGWRSVFLAMLALVVFAPVCEVRAEDPIKGEVKAVADGGYLRLTFQFEEAVEATTRVSGAIVVINFNKPVMVAVERLNVNAPDLISAARRDPDGSLSRLFGGHRCTRRSPLRAQPILELAHRLGALLHRPHRPIPFADILRLRTLKLVQRPEDGQPTIRIG